MKKVLFGLLVVVLSGVSTIHAGWTPYEIIDRAVGVSTVTLTPHPPPETKIYSYAQWDTFNPGEMYVHADSVGILDTQSPTIETSAIVGFGSANKPSRWEKGYIYKDCKDVEFTKWHFDYETKISWYVGGNAENYTWFTFGISSARGQHNYNVSYFPPSGNVPLAATGWWEGSKKEHDPLNKIALNMNWPPGLTLTWDLEGDIWGEGPHTKSDTGDGWMTNETAGGTLVNKVTIAITLKGEAWANTEVNSTEAEAEVRVKTVKFNF